MIKPDYPRLLHLSGENFFELPQPAGVRRDLVSFNKSLQLLKRPILHKILHYAYVPFDV